MTAGLSSRSAGIKPPIRSKAIFKTSSSLSIANALKLFKAATISLKVG